MPLLLSLLSCFFPVPELRAQSRKHQNFWCWWEGNTGASLGQGARDTFSLLGVTWRCVGVGVHSQGRRCWKEALKAGSQLRASNRSGGGRAGCRVSAVASVCGYQGGWGGKERRKKHLGKRHKPKPARQSEFPVVPEFSRGRHTGGFSGHSFSKNHRPASSGHFRPPPGPGALSGIRHSLCSKKSQKRRRGGRWEPGGR